MEQEQDIPWTQSTGHTSTRKRGNGQQTQRLGHLSLTRLMDRYQRIMSRAGMHKRIVSWRQWLSLKNPIQGSLKTHVLKRWKLFSKHEWTS
ncbi:PB1-F2 protein [Influenza A virus (A/shorebird/Delaware Bay/77/2001(H6N2))]|uniref:PB1-F2 protein n=4 Tax=Influenza A virus TaxID=11320 RepID=G7X161_9INFA|nr:PB1-F2 protein [Influenza A virus (A/shorebird/Delaware Bay/77/2001(H6N2))]AET77061.1 PB1-F2 protein [Influenza A virus (A/shorebird/Delaware Bay/113/2001(mixed))]AFX85819.1 PB1-F2 protein [Influenza A virus (A/shorebird/Delaware Bay/124/2001(H6N2))]AFX85830.1 PB1-F2 protein [Influenza A virus (A/shorebird/Delaware Bay/208/2001(H6N2))]